MGLKSQKFWRLRRAYACGALSGACRARLAVAATPASFFFDHRSDGRTDGRDSRAWPSWAPLSREHADLGLTCAAPTMTDVSRVLARVAHRAFARLDLAHADWRARTHAGARGAGARIGPRRESGSAGRHLLLPSRAPQRLPVPGGASAPHVLLAYSSQPPRCYRRRHRRHPRRRCAP